jgi:hypothetical protein
MNQQIFKISIDVPSDKTALLELSLAGWGALSWEGGSDGFLFEGSDGASYCVGDCDCPEAYNATDGEAPSSELWIALTGAAAQGKIIANLTDVTPEDGEDPCNTPTPTEPPDQARPPRPGGSSSVTHGEPHLTSFDGLSYDFQAVGEFIQAKSTVDDFEVQVRFQAPPRTDVVSVNSAVAMNVAGDRVAVYAGGSGTLFVNGDEVDHRGRNVELDSGGTVYPPYSGDLSFLIVWPDGTQLHLMPGDWGGGGGEGSSTVPAAQGFINSEIYLTPERASTMIGLLGDANGDSANDISTRDGQVLAVDQQSYQLPVSFEDLYQVYGKSWRISEDESLFDYGEGETTDSYTDLAFPPRPVSIDDLTAEERANAEEICRAAGIADEKLLRDCILDVGLTGFEEFATAVASLDGAEVVAAGPGDEYIEEVLFDDEGNMHVVWGEEDVNDYDSRFFHRVRSPDGVWSDPVQIDEGHESSDYYYFYDVLLDRSGNLHAFWESEREVLGVFESYPFHRMRNKDGEWGEAVQLSDTPVDSAYVNPLLDDAGNLHVVIHQTSPSDDSARIAIHRVLAPGETWSDPVVLNTAAHSYTYANLRHNPGTNVCVTLHTRTDVVLIALAERCWSDGAWSVARTVASAECDPNAYRCYFLSALDTAGRLQAVLFRDRMVLQTEGEYAGEYLDAQAPELTFNGVQLGDPAINREVRNFEITDDGRYHVFWQRLTGDLVNEPVSAELEYVYSDNKGVTWSAPEVIATPRDDDYLYPRFEGGDIWVEWEDHVNGTVFFRRWNRSTGWQPVVEYDYGGERDFAYFEFHTTGVHVFVYKAGLVALSGDYAYRTTHFVYEDGAWVQVGTDHGWRSDGVNVYLDEEGIPHSFLHQDAPPDYDNDVYYLPEDAAQYGE